MQFTNRPMSHVDIVKQWLRTKRSCAFNAYDKRMYAWAHEVNQWARENNCYNEHLGSISETTLHRIFLRLGLRGSKGRQRNIFMDESPFPVEVSFVPTCSLTERAKAAEQFLATCGNNGQVAVQLLQLAISTTMRNS